jgi:hypothetical protein
MNNCFSENVTNGKYLHSVPAEAEGMDQGVLIGSCGLSKRAFRGLLKVQQVPLPELQRGQEDSASKPRDLRQLGGGAGGGICALRDMSTPVKTKTEFGPGCRAHCGRQAKVWCARMRFL